MDKPRGRYAYSPDEQAPSSDLVAFGENPAVPDSDHYSESGTSLVVFGNFMTVEAASPETPESKEIAYDLYKRDHRWLKIVGKGLVGVAGLGMLTFIGVSLVKGRDEIAVIDPADSAQPTISETIDVKPGGGENDNSNADSSPSPSESAEVTSALIKASLSACGDPEMFYLDGETLTVYAEAEVDDLTCVLEGLQLPESYLQAVVGYKVNGSTTGMEETATLEWEGGSLTFVSSPTQGLRLTIS